MENAVEVRKISYIVHFTRLENVPLILNDGLKPHAALESSEPASIFNDKLRLDRHLDAICLSVSFPNYKMFYRLRRKNPDVKWAVLLLAPSLLWKKDCAFFSTNAASSRSSCQDIQDRKSVSAFHEMFDDKICLIQNENGQIENKSHREYYKVPINYPTDPQAEVLCFNDIDASYIKYVLFLNEKDKQFIHGTCKNFALKVFPKAFYGRFNHAAW